MKQIFAIRKIFLFRRNILSTPLLLDPDPALHAAVDEIGR